MNEFHVGIGGFAVTSFYVILLAFLWRVTSAKLAGSSNPVLSNLGGAMGATL